MQSNEISSIVKPGPNFFIVRPHGAGKETTTLRMIAGIIKANFVVRVVLTANFRWGKIF